MQKSVRLCLATGFLVATAACQRPLPNPPPAAPPDPQNGQNIEAPPGNANNPEPTDPNTPNPDDPNAADPNQPPAQPPVAPAQLDCNQLELSNGTFVNCSTVLNYENYCGSVYTNPDLPNEANFELVGACGVCDAQYFAAPTSPTGDALVCDNGVELPVPPVEGDPNFGGGVVTPDNETCFNCHAPNTYDGNYSIEDPHPWSNVQCTSCHGGDGRATNPVFAHVCSPPEVGNRQQQVLDTRAFFLSYTYSGIQFLPDWECRQQDGTFKTTTALEWLAFVSPGDIRAGLEGMGCGTCHRNEALKGGDVVFNVAASTMGNATGLNSGSRHGIGAPNKFAERNSKTRQYDWNSMADYGANAITNPGYDPANRKVGEVGSLAAPQVFTGQGFRYNQTYTADAVNNSLELNNVNADNYPNGINNNTAEELFQEVLNQACTGCHIQNGYNNNRAGDYRSTGCASCHFQTGVLGRSASQDPNSDKYEPIDPNNLTPGEKVHVADHRIRNVSKFPGSAPGLTVAIQGISDQNCLVCHEGSNRTVAQFHGYRLDQNQDLTNGNFYPSQNTVTFTNNSALFGENQNFNNRNINQWILDEVWQADVANVIVGQQGQDETPPDVHYEMGMGCVDCHGTGSTHGNGAIYSRMKVQTHENDLLCENCHGTIDSYAGNDGTYLIDQADKPLKNTIVNSALNGEFWLVSKVNGSQHYIPQVKDIVDATGAGGYGKLYPPGSRYNSQPLFNLVASYAMGRYQQSQDLRDGYGPEQVNSGFQVQDNFSHSDGYQYARGNNNRNQGLECYTCHAAWQNNCIGCHLDAYYDNNPANYIYSFVSGERIYFNFNANFVYQNPINFMMGINDRAKISPYQGLHRFFSYTDLNNNTSNRIAYSDRNGLGNDPQLKNQYRNNLPALENQPFTPHSIRSRYTQTEIGGKGCLDCHISNANQVTMIDQNANAWDLTAIIANQENYAAAIPFNVNQAYGLGTNLWQFDADGNAVFDTNNAPVYDLDRIVEADGTTNTSSNHPMLDPFGQTTNPDYQSFTDLNNARMVRPLTNQVLLRLINLNNNFGLSEVYYYNSITDQDPNDTGAYTYFLNDYNYVGQ